MTTELTTIVCAFNDQMIAGRAIDALRKAGFRDGDIKILKGDADKLIDELAEDECPLANGLPIVAVGGKSTS